jgi:hypothetical protein
MPGLMNNLGLLITVICVVVCAPAIFVVVAVLRNLGKADATRRRLLQTGAQAHARVLQIQMGGMTVTTGVNRQLQLQIAAEVHRPGTAPYAAQFTAMVSELQIPMVQPGSWLAVRVDPSNPTSIAIEAMNVAPPPQATASGGGQAPSPYGSPAAPAAPTPYGAPAGYAGAGAYAPTAAYGAPPAAAGAPGPGFSPPTAPPTAPPAAAYGGTPVAPMGGFRLPLGAKIGIGVGIAAVVVAIAAPFLMTGYLTGFGSPSDVCKRAAACCRKVARSSPAASNCDNIARQSGVIGNTVCEETLKSFRSSNLCK